MLLTGFEPTISAGERPQIHALDRAATGTGYTEHHKVIINKSLDYYHVLNCLLQTTISAGTAVLQHSTWCCNRLHRMYINKVRHAVGHMKRSEVSGIVSKIVTVVYDGKNYMRTSLQRNWRKILADLTQNNSSYFLNMIWYMTWYAMLWFDIWYDTIWYDIWYDLWYGMIYMIYMLRWHDIWYDIW